ncbi:hypothetical protein [Mycolicibacterium litorale]|uniref:hypothetical protein n=1 Tax=Mycolicibacterium litorale TaxID=758802 RepID=UPI0039A18A5B
MAFIPWLLMVATFGLQRVESGLVRDTMTTSDVDDFLEQAEAARQQNRPEPVETLPTRMPTDGLPTRVYIPQPTNPQFQPTRHVNRV